MDKFKLVLGVIIAISAVEALLSFVIPNILVPFANTANMTMAATANMTNFPGTSETMVAAPWLLYFAPPVIGIIVIVAALRFNKTI